MTLRLPVALVVATAALLLWTAAPAQSAGVAYLDGGEVWASTLDGQTKVRLSAGEGDWLAVAQGDGGQVVGVRNVPGRNGQFATFAVWQPDGTRSDEGPLQSKGGFSLNVMPVGLDITPDGRSMVYGYSQSRYDYGTFPATFVLETGTTVQAVSTRAAGIPFNISDQDWPTLAGSRVVGASSDHEVSLQAPAGQPPYSYDFVPWLATGGMSVRRTDVAASGRVAAIELYEPNPGSGDDLQERIGMFPLDGLGGSITPVDHDCFLPAQGGRARQPSLSQDGTRIAYVDGGGLRVAPVTDFATLVTDCVPTTPVTISPSGTNPSIGPIDVAALAARGGAPGGGGSGGPTTTTPGGGGGSGGGGSGAGPGPGGGGTGSPAPAVSIPSGTKATALAKGLKVTVTVARAGTVKLSLVASSRTLGLKGRARSVTVAAGSAKAKKAGKVAVRLTAARAYRSKLRRLRGTKVTLKIAFAGRTTTKTVRLR